MRGRLTWALLLSLLLVSILACAQADLRIARPVDGATVRETVNILVPAAAVPEGGFIACLVDDKFKCADAVKSDDGRYFVYRWNSKAIEKSPETGVELPRAKDGEHKIIVQVYDSEGGKVGNEQHVSIFLKNSAAADMPAEGLKLRYTRDTNTSNSYKCKYQIDLTNIQGATNITAALGEAVEGAEGVVRRSIEDTMPDDTILIRQKLTSALVRYTAGQPAAVPVVPKAFYAVEDTLGRMTYVMTSSSPGVSVSIDLPNMPSQRVKIGDSWGLTDKVFRNLITGESVAMTTSSTLEGLEWEGGHPCAKIKTRFSGTVKLPFSSFITQAIPIAGETTTYFAYRAGKVISSTTAAVSEPALPQSMVTNLTQALVSKAGGQGAGTYNATPGSGSMQGSDEQTVKIKMLIRQTIELVP